MKKTIQLLVVAATLSSGVAKAALVSYYTFDEASGSTIAVDSGSSAANGAIGSNVTLGTTGVLGTAFTFKNDATQNGIVDMGNATVLFAALAASQQLTISVWMKWSPTGDARDSAVFFGNDTAANRYVDVGTTTGGGVYGRSRDAATSGAPFSDLARGVGLNDGAWHHVAYTTNAATEVTQLYIDGVLAGSNTTPAVSFPAFNNFEIGRLGRSAPADAFSGSVDELRIFDAVLSSTEIAALAVPEPGSALLIGFAAAGLVFRRRK